MWDYCIATFLSVSRNIRFKDFETNLRGEFIKTKILDDKNRILIFAKNGNTVLG